MTKAEKLMERRANLVCAGVGMFGPSTVISAKGAIMIDADGKELIDFGGGIGVLNAGHCPEPVVEAIAAQAKKLIHSCFHVSAYEPYLDLCEKLISLFPHGGKTKAMLTNSGAESVENAIKIARQATGRSGVITFNGAFHGRTMMAMTLTSKIAYKYNCGPFAPEVYRLPFPSFYHHNDGLSYDDFIARELDRLDDAFVHIVNPQTVAAIIIEPVQGEGGFRVTPPEYLKGLRKACDKHGILLILDEVQSGFCRTGKWSAYEHYDVIPDISTWAKSMGSGMPIGAVLGKAEVMDKAQAGTVGGTYLGNPVSCAAALATLKFMEEENLNQKALVQGKTIMSRMKKLQAEIPAIGDVRGLGAMIAIEFVKEGKPNLPDTDFCKKFTDACFERGLILLNAGAYKNVVRFLCPLVMEEAILQKGLDIMEDELMKLTKGKLAAAL